MLNHIFHYLAEMTESIGIILINILEKFAKDFNTKQWAKVGEHYFDTFKDWIHKEVEKEKDKIKKIIDNIDEKIKEHENNITTLKLLPPSPELNTLIKSKQAEIDEHKAIKKAMQLIHGKEVK